MRVCMFVCIFSFSNRQGYVLFVYCNIFGKKRGQQNLNQNNPRCFLKITFIFKLLHPDASQKFGLERRKTFSAAEKQFLRAKNCPLLPPWGDMIVNICTKPGRPTSNILGSITPPSFGYTPGCKSSRARAYVWDVLFQRQAALVTLTWALTLAAPSSEFIWKNKI